MRKKIILLLCLMCVLLVACSNAESEETVAGTICSTPLAESENTEHIHVEETSKPTSASETTPTEAPTEIPTEPPTEPVAELIEEGLQVYLEGGDETSVLCDHNIWTKRRIQNHQQLTLVCDTPFSGVYFVWDSIPGRYTITWSNGKVEGGEYGFLHDYIRLPEAITQCTIEFLGEGDRRLCDVEVLTEGTAPDGIQAWLPPCEEADILVFPTHADDDTLFFGPLISYYAIERGLRVQTAFMVEHHGYPERGHERLNGLWEMGIRYYPILGTAPDTASYNIRETLQYYADSNIEQWQVEQIRRFKPLVVVGHDLEGEYGNAGHMVNALFLVRAIESAADEQEFPESADQYGLWTTPKLYLHLYPENEIILDVNVPMEKDPEGRTPFQTAEAGFACHKSQHQYGFHVQQGKNRVYDCRPFGLYRTLVGYDTCADIMENIDVQKWRDCAS